MIAVAAASGCAMGTEGGGDDDVTGRPDASLLHPDAPWTPDAASPDARPIDASLPPDASTVIPDASVAVDSGDTGLFCQSTQDCAGQPGTCCFFLAQPPGFCVPGQEVLGVCFPN